MSRVPAFAKEDTIIAPSNPERITVGKQKEVVIEQDEEIQWYSLTPEKTTKYAFYSDASNDEFIDTYGYIYAYNEDDQFVCIAENDDSHGYDQFLVVAQLEEGKTYYLGAKSLDGSNENQSFVVNVIEDYVETKLTVSNATLVNEEDEAGFHKMFYNLSMDVGEITTLQALKNDDASLEDYFDIYYVYSSDENYSYNEENYTLKAINSGTACIQVNYSNICILVQLEVHDWQKETYTNNAIICTEKHLANYKCSLCNEIKSVEEEALGHNYSTEYTIDKEPTCTEAGSQSRHCIDCDAKTDITEISKTGHSWNNGKVTKEATCTAEGIKTYTCAVCGKTKPEPIKKLDHQYSTEYTIDQEPTCTESGSQSRHCIDCDAKTDITEISKTGRNFKIKIEFSKDGKSARYTAICNGTMIMEECEMTSEVLKPATCVTKGTTRYTATAIVDGQEVTATKDVQDIDLAKHKQKSTVKQATLTKNGKITYTCTVCHKKLKDSTIYYPKTIKLSKTTYTYDGKVKKPTVIVTDSKGKKISLSNCSVIYSSGRKNVGVYKVTVKFKGNYKGTKTLTFKINPKGTSVSKLTAKSKAIVVKVKKQATQTTGYQIQYSTDKSFKKNVKTVTIKKNSTVSTTIKKLSAKKKYYVRVRTYKTVSKKDYYSLWSAVKKVTTKK
jgi:hypothetical protein